jgi:hypothetical protein
MRQSILIGFLLASPPALDAQAAIAGVLREDSSKTAIAGAQVVIQSLNRSATTDTGGRYTIGGLPRGTHQVLIRAIGYQPILLRAYLVTDDTLELVLSMKKSIMELAPLEVTASAVPTGLESFEERRLERDGVFMDWTQLRKEDHRRTVDLFYGIRGVKVMYDGAGRGWLVGTHKNCPMQVLLNGAIIAPRSIDSWRIENLDAIEVYRSGAETPAQFASGGSCGTVILWTRRH